MNKTLLSLALFAIVGTVWAQDAAPTSLEIAASTEEAQAEAALQALEQSLPVMSEPQQVLGAPIDPSLVDPTSNFSNDNLVREIARIRQRQSVLEAQSALEGAQFDREQERLNRMLENLELRRQVLAELNGGVAPATEGSPMPLPSATPGSAPPIVNAPQITVRSIYGFGDAMYAEIYIGNYKMVATRGALLASGHRVLNISQGVVHLRGPNGETERLYVAGSSPVEPMPSAQ